MSRKEDHVSKKKKKEKKARKQTIKIFFKDGKTDEIPSKLYTNYNYDGKLFIVINKEQWIAMYNMDEVACITVG